MVRTTGDLGEKIAVEFLQENGYQILHANWRFGRCEIDIIARIAETLVFVEVKTRSGSSRYGFPESFVSCRKQMLLLQCAQGYIKENLYIGQARFDVISVRIQHRTETDVRGTHVIDHFIDAFYGIY